MRRGEKGASHHDSRPPSDPPEAGPAAAVSAPSGKTSIADCLDETCRLLLVLLPYAPAVARDSAITVPEPRPAAAGPPAPVSASRSACMAVIVDGLEAIAGCFRRAAGSRSASVPNRLSSEERSHGSVLRASGGALTVWATQDLAKGARSATDHCHVTVTDCH